ncbi:hypothetical protein [Nocardia terpenica]|uniref:Cysteine-rich domain-containing protein n=1 Tax=Nocardia terpenica TaxID=455432 RepID=A0A161WP96_9NOCA|nr:hypothetical protein [Nocardia terpenica]KZM74965.1 hypothetical protein AWN90_23440 [Nocardia terpenica]NQE93371.1 hypothetical protein [Nocardia terpenica]
MFRDELGNLFPDDLDALRLARAARTLGEFLTERDYRPPALPREALVQTHCHDHAVLRPDADRVLLTAMGMNARYPDSGCCGMAGSFGFESGERYRVSMAAGERVILPEVRRAGPETCVIANGFSCREQITQATGRRPWHLAEAIRLAIHEEKGKYP